MCVWVYVWLCVGVYVCVSCWCMPVWMCVCVYVFVYVCMLLLWLCCCVVAAKGGGPRTLGRALWPPLHPLARGAGVSWLGGDPHTLGEDPKTSPVPLGQGHWSILAGKGAQEPCFCFASFCFFLRERACMCAGLCVHGALVRLCMCVCACTCVCVCVVVCVLIIISPLRANNPSILNSTASGSPTWADSANNVPQSEQLHHIELHRVRLSNMSGLNK